MRRILYVTILIGICIFLYWIYITDSNKPRQIKIILGRLRNYNQILSNDRILDTYYHRILRFLNERNVSFSSYEEVNATNDILRNDINTKIHHLHQFQREELFNLTNGQELKYGCQKSCRWFIKKTKYFYNGEEGRSPTFLDRISHIDIKLLADLHYGGLPVPGDIQLPKLTPDILPCLQSNTIIFVDSTDIGSFLNKTHNNISVNYILITGDSDDSCPLNINRSHFHILDKIFAGKTRIIHWFAMNCDLGNNEQWKKSKIFTCIPQGISQWANQRAYMQLASGKDDSIYNTDLKANDYWVLTSFARGHASEIRQPLFELSCNGRLKNISKCFYQSDSLDLWKYYFHVGRSKFVFSPPGAGMDCYRTWEALYLGSIPIVLNSSLNSIYDKLPVLIVNKYEEINLEFLKNVYDKMTKRTYDYRRLYKGYWQREINYYRNSREMIRIHYTN